MSIHPSVLVLICVCVCVCVCVCGCVSWTWPVCVCWPIPVSLWGVSLSVGQAVQGHVSAGRFGEGWGRVGAVGAQVQALGLLQGLLAAGHAWHLLPQLLEVWRTHRCAGEGGEGGGGAHRSVQSITSTYADACMHTVHIHIQTPPMQKKDVHYVKQ